MNTSPKNPKEIVVNCVPQEADSEMEIRMNFCFITTTCGMEETEAKLSRNWVVIGAVGGLVVRTCLQRGKPGV